MDRVRGVAGWTERRASPSARGRTEALAGALTPSPPARTRGERVGVRGAFDGSHGTRDEARKTGPRVPRRLSCLWNAALRKSGLRLRWGQGFGFRSSGCGGALSISRRRSENANP